MKKRPIPEPDYLYNPDNNYAVKAAKKWASSFKPMSTPSSKPAAPAVEPTPADKPAQWRTATHDNEVFLEFRRKDGPWVDAGVLFVGPGFTAAELNAMLNTLNATTPPDDDEGRTDARMIAKLTEDKERLDWLENTMRHVLGAPSPERTISCNVHLGASIRTEIDAARGAQ